MRVHPPRARWHVGTLARRRRSTEMGFSNNMLRLYDVAVEECVAEGPDALVVAQ